MDKNNIREIVQEEIQKYMTQSQYDISQIPSHDHTDVNSLPIPIAGIKESVSITGIPNGVFNRLTLGNQKVNNEYITTRPNPQTTYILPVNIIYGFGPGVDGAFNGGDAEPGTMLFFENGLTLSALWIKTINGWYGISPDLTA